MRELNKKINQWLDKPYHIDVGFGIVSTNNVTLIITGLIILLLITAYHI